MFLSNKSAPLDVKKSAERQILGFILTLSFSTSQHFQNPFVNKKQSLTLLFICIHKIPIIVFSVSFSLFYQDHFFPLTIHIFIIHIFGNINVALCFIFQCFKRAMLHPNAGVLTCRSSMRVGLASHGLWVAWVTEFTSSLVQSLPLNFCSWPYAGWLMSRSESIQESGKDIGVIGCTLHIAYYAKMFCDQYTETLEVGDCE